MTTIRTQLRNAAVGVAIAETIDDLAAIRKPGCAAAIWRRPLMPATQSWFDGLEPQNLPSTRIVVRPDAVEHTLKEVFDVAGLPDGPERGWLEADVTTLTTHFTSLMRAPYVRLRLDVVADDACSKFHIDTVLARLICTYRGSGTQYGISPDGAPPNRVFQIPTGAPMILRGTLWPADPPSGLLHRSPPIGGSGEVRLVLVLDPIFDVEDA